MALAIAKVTLENQSALWPPVLSRTDWCENSQSHPGIDWEKISARQPIRWRLRQFQLRPSCLRHFERFKFGSRQLLRRAVAVHRNTCGGRLTHPIFWISYAAYSAEVRVFYKHVIHRQIAGRLLFRTTFPLLSSIPFPGLTVDDFFMKNSLHSHTMFSA